MAHTGERQETKILPKIQRPQIILETAKNVKTVPLLLLLTLVSPVSQQIWSLHSQPPPRFQH